MSEQPQRWTKATEYPDMWSDPDDGPGNSADEAATRLRRLQRAIEAGAEPEALVEAINRAKEERDAALIELDRVPVTRASSRAEVDALIDHLSVIGGTCGMPSRRTYNGSTRNCGSTWSIAQKKGPWMWSSNRPVGIVSVSEGGLEPPPPFGD